MVGRNAQHAQRRPRLALAQIGIAHEISGRDVEFVEFLGGADPKAIAVCDDDDMNFVAASAAPGASAPPRPESRRRGEGRKPADAARLWAALRRPDV